MTQLIILTQEQIDLAQEKAELLDLLIQSVEQASNQAKSDSEGMDEVMYRASEVHKSFQRILNTIKLLK
jgi:methylphosphotriester-DNA--protein-cysteine methyltransferase